MWPFFMIIYYLVREIGETGAEAEQEAGVLRRDVERREPPAGMLEAEERVGKRQHADGADPLLTRDERRANQHAARNHRA